MGRRKGRKVGGFDPDNMMRQYAEGPYIRKHDRLMSSGEVHEAVDKWVRKHKKRKRHGKSHSRFKKSNWV